MAPLMYRGPVHPLAAAPAATPDEGEEDLSGLFGRRGGRRAAELLRRWASGDGCWSSSPSKGCAVVRSPVLRNDGRSGLCSRATYRE